MPFDTDYLDRIGVQRPPRADAETLRVLHAAHLTRVPFENLSIHLGEPISLEPHALRDKIIDRRRGGFCYELNGLFARLLDALGYRVELLAARVWGGQAFGPPLDHLALGVQCESECEDERWLADVGFGAHSLYPLRVEHGLDQDDPGGRFGVERAPHGDLDVWRDGVLQYRVEAHPRTLAEFEAMCWYQQNSPRSHFTRNVVCSLQTTTGRVTLSGDRLVRTVHARKEETRLADDTEILRTYADVFGIVLDRVPPQPR